MKKTLLIIFLLILDIWLVCLFPKYAQPIGLVYGVLIASIILQKDKGVNKNE